MLDRKFATGVLLACAFARPGFAGTYTFTPIADTGGPYSSMSPFSPHVSLNEAGEVAFAAGLDAGGLGVFKGSGGAVATIASGASFFVSATSINDAGVVAFHPPRIGGIVLGSGGPTTTIYSSPTPYPPAGGPSLNNLGRLAFYAQAATNSNRYIASGDGTPATLIADNTGQYSTFKTSPEINDAGQVVWSANYDAQATHQTLYRTSASGTHTTIADSITDGFTFLDEFVVNSSGEVAFGGNKTDRVGIYRSSGAGITSVVDNTGPYSLFTDGNLRPKPALNDNGNVAFWATLDGPSPVTQGIFTGPNPATDAVIKTGDTLLGATVTDLAFSGRGFNNSGQIAFVAVLSDGRTAVVRADAPGLYWDTNGSATPGAGGPAPSGNWNGTAANFNTDATGGSAGSTTAVTTASDTVIFAAGNDGAGAYTVTVSGTQAAAKVSVARGSVTLAGGTLAVGVFDVAAEATAAATSTIASPSGSVTKSGAGTLRLTKLPQGNAMTISAGRVEVLESTPGLGSGHPAGNNASVSRPSALSIAPGATMDLTNNDLILDYSGASPLATYEALVASGYNAVGNWQGDGITSSIAAADGNYVVAIADNATLAAPFGTAQGGPLFAGVDVDLTTILVKFTHRADINLDGLITPDDSAIFGGNYNQNQPAVWATGDMNYDGVFTPDDAAIFGGAYDQSLASLPEPASAALLAVAGLALSRRRR